MTRAWYGGIELQDAHVIGHQHRPIWHGPNYLWTHHVLGIRARFNPATCAWDLPGKRLVTVPVGQGVSAATGVITQPGAGAGAPAYVGPTPWQNPGGSLPPAGGIPASSVLGSVTHQAVRHLMMQPQQQLVLMSGGFIHLCSPLLRPDVDGVQYAVDANNGPKPIDFKVLYEEGIGKTWVVEFWVETWLTECDLFRYRGNANTFTALLSHRWTMHHSVDVDAMVVRTIRGQAIFRTDRLALLGTRPDDYRAWLFHPLMPNSHRTAEVEAGADGNTLLYTITDREKPFNLVCGQNVTRIEATYTCAVGKMGPDNMISETVPSVVESIGNFAFGSAIRRFGDDLLETAGKAVHEFVVRVWGNRNANRVDLAKVAQKIIDSRISVMQVAISSTTGAITSDLVGKFVEARLRVKSGFFTNLAQGVMLTFQGMNFYIGADELDGVTSSTQMPPAPQGNPASGNDRLGDWDSRGTYLNAAQAAAFQAACAITDAPAGPQEPAQYTDAFPGQGNQGV